MGKQAKQSLLAPLLLLVTIVNGYAQNGALVFQTDFGVKEGAVAAMKGVAYGVSRDIRFFDLTHEIPAYNIWEAAYRLQQTLPYWPEGTVFVSVVDPGVGSERKSVVAKTRSGHFIVTPDNGTLTLLADAIGIDSLRRIDETRNRLKGSSESYTFHGRDVYAYTGARLAAGVIRYDEVGPALPPNVVRIPYQAAQYQNGSFTGNIPVLDVQYGNVWTNIPLGLLRENGLQYGDQVEVNITVDNKLVYKGVMPFATTFSAVAPGKPVAYVNSLLNFSFGINQGNFASQHKVSSGSLWKVTVTKKPKP
ncbi:S-adenosyl-l-methionine hydroxide adenosyltransferase family protein [Flavihumibacter rivuli]|uniref:SAM hydrolase/SAM-dependent halogenase family protein n=1 Tax=Flavihumibacter rivuli TaxID=2838156 RepID=UPI001BDE4319|nr:S-adenosyl-l-methionine hydroxide adenosyltransferase family protein [Flavihumibacter rivuli]ULQ56208.1 S-adenosyl-l-methionine hydroxide adenosyltransferase family protein [Flavihumibacter rivuli]